MSNKIKLRHSPLVRGPRESGSYDVVVSSVRQFAASVGRTILVGACETVSDFDEDGIHECVYVEIELLCPHGNATDGITYMADVIEGSTPKWHVDEIGTDAFFDCRCQGITM